MAMEAISDELLALDEIGMTNCSMKEGQQYYSVLLQKTASEQSLSH
jgi:hypothetical protein